MTPCELCRGACCETIAFAIPAPSEDVSRWMGYHGTPTKLDGKIELRLAAPCSKLDAGRCSIHPDRPQVCRDYTLGGAECRASIRRQRAASAASEIENLLDMMRVPSI